MLAAVWSMTFAGAASAQPSFDCQRASTATEHAICQDDGLAQADRAMARVYKALRTDLPNAGGELLASQRAFLSRRDACGGDVACIAVQMRERMQELLALQQPSAPAPTPAPAAAGDCGQMLAAAGAVVGSLTVHTASANATSDPETVAVGGEIKVQWRTSAAPGPALPLYLVIDTPPEVRFAGTGFLALAAGAKGPHGLSIARDRARAIVPLHKPQAGPDGEAGIVPWRAGPVQIGWTVATAGPCGERVLAEREADDFSIRLGAPQLVVQDPFADDRPSRRIRDNGGRYDLLVFDGRYEVHDAVNGGRILRREGYDPNFSPTGRFVAARDRIHHSLEIVDLVSGEMVLEFGPGLLAWARNDSLVIHSTTDHGIVGYTWTLGVGAELDAFGCKICRGWHSADVILNMDEGFAAIISTLTSAVQDLHGGDKNEFDSGIRSVGKRVDRDVRAETYRHIRSTYGDEVELVPRRWDLGEPLKLSHMEVYLGGDSVGQPYDRTQEEFLVHHQVMPLTVDDGQTAVVEGPRVGTDVMFERIAAALGTRLAATTEAQRETFEPPYGRPYGSGPTPEHRAAVGGLVDRLVRDIPGLQQHLTEEEDGAFCAVGADALDPAYIKSAWSWKSDGATRYILENACIAGSMRFVYGSLLLASTDAPEPLIALGEALASAVEGGRLFAGHGSVPGVFPAGQAQVLLADPASGNAALFDERSGARKGALLQLVDAVLLAGLRLTPDRRHAVQLNSDGSFHVHRLDSGARVLLGAHVDDEVVVMTEDGRYDTTFEGAHALQVRFEGAPGLFTVHQFAGALSRPGLAAAVLSGADVAPREGALAPPPTVELALAGQAQGRRAATVVARSASGLARLQVFVDGRQVEDAAVSGREATLAVDIADPGGGRWLTAVAIDGDGLASRPSGVRLPGQPRPSGAYRAIAIGVDRYTADPKVQDLDFAVADARRFISAVETAAGRAAARVDTTLLLDEAATPGTVLDAVREAAARTRPEDVLLVFYAGHGADGRAFDNSTTDELVLTVSNSRIADLAATAIPWSALAAALDGARGKVVVVLDACHAGLAGSEAFLSHDEAVGALFTASGAPLVVLAASKGRQVAIEDAARGGGYFTIAVADALSGERQAVDRDGSGLIDVSELYRAVKRSVGRATDGVQTPWMARNGLVGEISLF